MLPPRPRPRSGLPPEAPSRLRAASNVTLFLALTGLAVGLAPKEWRYAGGDSPQVLGPPLPSLAFAGIQLCGCAMLTASRDGSLDVWSGIRELRKGSTRGPAPGRKTQPRRLPAL